MHHAENLPFGTEFEAFFRSLRIAPAGPEIATAADVLKAAKEARSAAQARHQEAGKRLSNQKLGEAPDITHSEVDALGAQIAPAIAAEEAAQAEYDRLLSEYRQNVISSLKEPLQRYHATIEAKIAELEMLISLGSLLHTESAAAKFKLPSKVPSLCPHIMVHVAGIRAILSVSNR